MNSRPESSVRHQSETQRSSVVRISQRPSITPIYNLDCRLIREDSGVALEETVPGFDQDGVFGPFSIVGEMVIENSNPFCWQLEPYLGDHADAIPNGGYCWSSEDTKTAAQKTERSHRIWENYFWHRGDREQHFPPIKPMASVPKSKFERMTLCSYPQQPQPRSVRRVTHSQGARTRNCLPIYDAWTGHLPPPPPPPPPLMFIGPNQQIQQSTVKHLHPANFRLQMTYAPNLHVPRGQILMPPPDRYYPLGEDTIYTYQRDGRCTALKNDNGRAIGDTWMYGLRIPVVALEPWLRDRLWRACEAMIFAERMRPGRYMSWTHQVDYKMWA